MGTRGQEGKFNNMHKIHMQMTFSFNFKRGQPRQGVHVRKIIHCVGEKGKPSPSSQMQEFGSQSMASRFRMDKRKHSLHLLFTVTPYSLHSLLILPFSLLTLPMLPSQLPPSSSKRVISKTMAWFSHPTAPHSWMERGGVCSSLIWLLKMTIQMGS